MQFFNLIVTAVLARVLLPEDFGLVGMALIIIGLVSIINDTGFSSALIQKKELEDGHIYTAFWTNIATAILLYCASYLASPFVADFFNNNLVEDIIKVASISYLISAITIVHRSLLTRDLKFKILSITEIIGSFLSGTIAIVMAMYGFGPWSLVARNILNDFFVVSMTLVIFPWKPALKFSKKCFWDLFGFSANVVSSGFLNYLRQNLDYIIIGRFMGAELLGYYTLAYTMAIFPSRRIAPVISRVIFPTFSVLQDNHDLYKKGYLKIMSFLSLITLPSLIGLAAVAPEVITLIYGEKWSPSILPFQILCVLGIINTISHPSGSIFYSKGVPNIELKLNIIKLPIAVLAIMAGSYFGITGVALATTLVSFIYLVYTQKIINSLITLSWQEYLSVTKTYLLGSLLMVIIMVIYRKIVMMSGLYDQIFMLVSSTILGICIYSAVVFKVQPGIIKTIKAYLKQSVAK
jgi:PST family polysaccharide transporter